MLKRRRLKREAEEHQSAKAKGNQWLTEEDEEAKADPHLWDINKEGLRECFHEAFEMAKRIVKGE